MLSLISYVLALGWLATREFGVSSLPELPYGLPLVIVIAQIAIVAAAIHVECGRKKDKLRLAIVALFTRADSIAMILLLLLGGYVVATAPTWIGMGIGATLFVFGGYVAGDRWQRANKACAAIR